MKGTFSISLLFAIIIVVCFSFFTALGEEAANTSRPWETSSELAGTISNDPKGYDKIETIIQTTGGTREDGKQVSSSGGDKNQQFVDDFLHQTATTIKQVGGGSGWAWSWEKKWKIGPDGKPYEVKETWAEGTVGAVSKPGDRQPGTVDGPGTVTQPTTTSAQPNSSQTNSPIATNMPSTQSGSVHPKEITPAVTPTNASKTSPESKGVDIAPIKLPQPPVTLSIFDPVSQQESKFTAALNPQGTAKPPLTASISKPIYEDTRVKIGLEVSPEIDHKDLSVTIKDNEGEHNFNAGTFPENYRHIFRVPNQTDYRAKVVYNHPISHDKQEIIDVQIPVLKMGFKNRTVEDSSKRSGTVEVSNTTSKEEAAWGIQGNSSHIVSSKNSNSASSNDSSVDMSDFYINPTFPSKSRGYDSKSAESSADAPQAFAADSAESGRTQIADGGHTGVSLKAGKSKIADGSEVTAVTALSNENQNESSSENAYNDDHSPATSENTNNEEDAFSSSDAQSSEYTPGTSDHGNEISEGSNSSPCSPANASSGSSSQSSNTSNSYPAAGLINENDETVGRISTAVATAEVATQDKPYIVSISIHNKMNNNAQSFDFVNDPQPTADGIAPQTSLAFGFDYAPEVKRDSLKIEIYDGSKAVRFSPKEMSSDFIEYVFNNPTQEAYIWIYGRTDKAPFSYKVIIPVKSL